MKSGTAATTDTARSLAVAGRPAPLAVSTNVWSPGGVSFGIVATSVNAPTGPTLVAPRDTGVECSSAEIVTPEGSPAPLKVSLSPGCTLRRSMAETSNVHPARGLTATAGGSSASTTGSGSGGGVVVDTGSGAGGGAVVDSGAGGGSACPPITVKNASCGTAPWPGLESVTTITPSPGGSPPAGA